MSTYKGVDDCTDTILDFIRGGWTSQSDHKQHNMEAAGYYDVMLGETKPSQDLGHFTISQIYALQDRWINSHGGSACGGYQFIKATLVTMVALMKFDVGKVLFTPATQDRLAVKLLTTRRYQRWWVGALSDSEFAHQLSLEWASFPDPMNGGLSHYQGVGPNQAGCALRDVLSMLTLAKSRQPKA